MMGVNLVCHKYGIIRITSEICLLTATLADKDNRLSNTLPLEVSDYDILRHHNSRIMTYHDCENYHDCHIMQIFGTNKQAVVYKNHVTLLF